MQKTGDQWLVRRTATDLARSRQGAHGEAVVPLIAGDDLVAVLSRVPLPLALAGDLESGLVGLGAGVGEEHAGQVAVGRVAGQQLGKLGRQQRRRLVDL